MKANKLMLWTMLMLAMVGMASASCEITNYSVGDYNGAANPADMGLTWTFGGATQHDCTGDDWCALAQNSSTWLITFNASWTINNSHLANVNVTSFIVEKCNSSFFNSSDRVTYYNGTTNVNTSAWEMVDFDADGIYEYNISANTLDGNGLIVYANQSINASIVIQMWAQNPYNSTLTTVTGAGQYEVTFSATNPNKAGCNISQTYLNVTLDDSLYESDLEVKVFDNVSGIYADITPLKLDSNWSCNRFPLFTNSGNQTKVYIQSDRYVTCVNDSDRDKVPEIIYIYIPSYNGQRLFKILGQPTGAAGMKMQIGPTPTLADGRPVPTTQPRFMTAPQMVLNPGQVGTGLVGTRVTFGDDGPSIPLPVFGVMFIVFILILYVWKTGNKDK